MLGLERERSRGKVKRGGGAEYLLFAWWGFGVPSGKNEKRP